MIFFTIFALFLRPPRNQTLLHIPILAVTMEPAIQHFKVSYGLMEYDCWLITGPIKTYIINIDEKAITLTKEQNPEGMYDWLYNGESSGFSEAYGAAIEEAEKANTTKIQDNEEKKEGEN